MRVTLLWFGIAFFSALIFVICGRKIAEYRLVKGRQPMQHTFMYRESVNASEVSFEVFEKTMTALQRAFWVDSHRLRPSDKLRDLYHLDSWVLGRGSDEMNKWIHSEYDLDQIDIEPETILDLMKLLERKSRERSHR